jgi:hypothetical protein
MRSKSGLSAIRDLAKRIALTNRMNWDFFQLAGLTEDRRHRKTIEERSRDEIFARWSNGLAPDSPRFHLDSEQKSDHFLQLLIRIRIFDIEDSDFSSQNAGEVNYKPSDRSCFPKATNQDSRSSLPSCTKRPNYDSR